MKKTVQGLREYGTGERGSEKGEEELKNQLELER